MITNTIYYYNEGSYYRTIEHADFQMQTDLSFPCYLSLPDPMINNWNTQEQKIHTLISSIREGQGMKDKAGKYEI